MDFYLKFNSKEDWLENQDSLLDNNYDVDVIGYYINRTGVLSTDFLVNIRSEEPLPENFKNFEISAPMYTKRVWFDYTPITDTPVETVEETDSETVL